MFQDTRPADLDGDSGTDPWAEFRVTQPQESLGLLRALRDGNVPVILNAPDGHAMAVTLWTVDSAQGRLNFSVADGAPPVASLIDANEAVAVAYLQNVKLQFDLHDFMLVRAASSSALQCRMPREIYRFQRRSAYRVRPRESHGPIASLRHPALPDMRLALRVMDVSMGGCALWLPHDVPPLQAGTLIADVQVELDAETRFTSTLRLQHVSGQGVHSTGASQPGARLGCEWEPLSAATDRVLQRWIDRTQRRHHLLTLG